MIKTAHVHCIRNGILLGGGATFLLGPTSLPLVLKGLSMLSAPTGCDGIVDTSKFDLISKIGSLGSLEILTVTTIKFKFTQLIIRIAIFHVFKTLLTFSTLFKTMSHGTIAKESNLFHDLFWKISGLDPPMFTFFETLLVK
jgi:hypothetical protein